MLSQLISNETLKPLFDTMTEVHKITAIHSRINGGRTLLAKYLLRNAIENLGDKRRGSRVVAYDLETSTLDFFRQVITNEKSPVIIVKGELPRAMGNFETSLMSDIEYMWNTHRPEILYLDIPTVRSTDDDRMGIGDIPFWDKLIEFVKDKDIQVIATVQLPSPWKAGTPTDGDIAQIAYDSFEMVTLQDREHKLLFPVVTGIGPRNGLEFPNMHVVTSADTFRFSCQPLVEELGFISSESTPSTEDVIS